MSQNEVAAAQFDIQNIGGSRSSTYYFRATLPTITGYTYNSAAQSPLDAGDHVINTLRWTQSAPSGSFGVSLSGGSDSNTANNVASQWIGGTTYNYNPQQVPSGYMQY